VVSLPRVVGRRDTHPPVRISTGLQVCAGHAGIRRIAAVQAGDDVAAGRVLAEGAGPDVMVGRFRRSVLNKAARSDWLGIVGPSVYAGAHVGPAGRFNVWPPCWRRTRMWCDTSSPAGHRDT
jgi:hypothetical protein